jgi:hypothetical protein
MIKKNWYRRKICGLYRLWDKVSGKSYVGKSKDIFSRWAEHSGGVGTDISRAFSERPTDFCWEVLETCDEAQLGAREMFWIILYAEQPAGVYNKLVARSPGARKRALARATASYEVPEQVAAAVEDKRRARAARKAAREEAKAARAAASLTDHTQKLLDTLRHDSTWTPMAEDNAPPAGPQTVAPPTLAELEEILSWL